MNAIWSSNHKRLMMNLNLFLEWSKAMTKNIFDCRIKSTSRRAVGYDYRFGINLVAHIHRQIEPLHAMNSNVAKGASRAIHKMDFQERRIESTGEEPQIDWLLGFDTAERRTL